MYVRLELGMPESPPVLGTLESIQGWGQRNKSTDDSILKWSEDL